MTSSKARLLLQVLIAISVFYYSVSPCLDQPLPASEWISDSDLEQLQVTATHGDNVLVLLTYDSVFTCQGSVSQWSLRWYHRGATNQCATIKFSFVVYRIQSDECSNLMFLGRNAYRVENAGPEMEEVESVFYVEPTDRIAVEEGDIMGVRVDLDSECMSESSVWVAGRTVVGSQLYHRVFSSVFGAILNTAWAPCSELQQSNVFPFVSAVVIGQIDGHSSSGGLLPSSRSVQLTSKQPKVLSSTEIAPSISLTTFSSLEALVLESNVPKLDSGATTTSTIGGTDVREDGEKKSRNHTLLITLGTGCCVLLMIINAIALTLMFLLRYRPPPEGTRRRRRTGSYNNSQESEPRHSGLELSLPDPEYDQLSHGTVTSEGVITTNDVTSEGMVTTNDVSSEGVHTTNSITREGPPPTNNVSAQNMGHLVLQGQAYRMTINKSYGSLPACDIAK